MRRAFGVAAAIVACGGAHRAPPPAAAVAPAELGEWSTCTTEVDVRAENAPATRALEARRNEHRASLYDVIIVPGFTPLDAAAPSAVVHPTAAERLDAAMAHWRGGGAPFILVSGANVHPPGTPYVEAMLMKRYLLDHGIAPEAIVVEPCARHSHTNLRDAGRFMLRFGLSKALIVTSRDQAFYFANQVSSSFEARCLADLGYRVGELRSLPDATVEFRPSASVLQRGNDPLDP